MQQQPKYRRSVIVTMLVVVGLLAASLVATGAPNGSTTKNLSSNFTLVNLAPTGTNTVSINYYKPDGTPWRASETEQLVGQGAQVQKKQYFDTLLTPGSGSVVVGGSGAMGGVVQILARDQTASSGAYSGASQGAQTFNIPLVAKNASSGSGTVNAQIVVQNTGAVTTFTVDVVKEDGTIVRTTDARSLASGAAFTYDLADDAAVPTGFYSAVVKAASGGQVAVVVNLFFGPNMLQTYSGFASSATKWIAPLVFSRLGNGLSTPITVQNLSGGPMAAGEITLNCIGATGFGPLTISNPGAIANTAFASFNPVGANPAIWPTGWYGSCTINTGTKASVVFVQMRELGTDRGAAYEGIRADGTKKKVIIPLYVKRGTNGFATVTTVQNLSTTTDASVIFSYRAAAGQPAGCTVDVPATIPKGGSVMQNLRIEGGDNSVPALPSGCSGSIVVSASTDTPIDAVIQLTDLRGLPGDTTMAHDGFTAD